MGTNIPHGRRDILNWAEGRIDDWTANQASIGLTSAQVAELMQEIENARQAQIDLETIRAQALTATQYFNSRADIVHALASNAVTAIKSLATNSDDPNSVYLGAGITGTKAPSPAPAPDMPTNVRAQLQTDGTINVRWDGRGPTGSSYEVYRKLPNDHKFVLLGTTGARPKLYNDASVPTGVASVNYSIRGVRGGKHSPHSPVVSMQFGPIAIARKAA